MFKTKTQIFESPVAYELYKYILQCSAVQYIVALLKTVLVRPGLRYLTTGQTGHKIFAWEHLYFWIYIIIQYVPPNEAIKEHSINSYIIDPPTRISLHTTFGRLLSQIGFVGLRCLSSISRSATRHAMDGTTTLLQQIICLHVRRSSSTHKLTRASKETHIQNWTA